MGQQLNIIVLIDIAAAIEANALRDHIWLVDNGGWNGSRHEGTPDLVTALDVTDIGAGPPVLNWLPVGIGAVPVAVPQTFFLADSAPGAPGLRSMPGAHGPHFPLRMRNILGDDIDIARPETGLFHAGPPEPGMICSGKGFRDPGTARFHRSGRSRVAEPGDHELVYHPNPVITRVCGEAMALGVFYPAQYGSPELFSDGLYWSASVDPCRRGLYSYTLWITLSYARRDRHGTVTDHSLTLSHDAYLSLSTGAMRSGFTDMGGAVAVGPGVA
ncbi:hypothetical protein [Sphingomonas abaci]|uniref:Uncharacterized protein n=1 Tax=Sphingomonas abaci TaxID=237611 RepID=A0A7W7ALU5_9SPHN|nr:hypothetical protein [Sphingomonas abaci]MBB4618387.1 hypothetical protein [Sphingomonas abaci]